MVPSGYHTFRSPTNNVFLFWRAPMKKGPAGPEMDESVAHIEQTIVYPLRAGIPSEWEAMQFPDASGVPLNMMYPTDASFYDRLAEFIDYEPEASVDPYLRGMMASIGIIKGQPFKPDERQRGILDKAAQAAHKIAGAIVVSMDELMPGRLYYPGKRQWFNAYSGVDDRFFSNGYLNLDVQSAFFTGAYSSAPYMNVNAPGIGARYPGTIRDADGEYLVGDRTYRLHLPPNVPAALFWSVTAYIPADGRMIDAGQPFPSINSMSNIAQNADGSYDLHFGPQLPDGAPESNWIKTNPGEGYMVALRLCGATMPFYDQSWIPDDVVEVP